MCTLFPKEKGYFFIFKDVILVKKILSLLLALTLIFSLAVPVFSVSQSYNGVTTAKTPIGSGSLLFSKKFGSGYKNAPTPPCVVGNTLIISSGTNLFKVNSATGEVISNTKMSGSSIYATVPPIYAGGKIFVCLDGGIVQAFDYKTFKSLWIYTDPLGGQALCPITYDSGYIYTGFWNNETEYANYVCLSTKDENTAKENESKKALWTYKALGGFYWAGCAVSKSFVVLGKDDGKDGSSGNNKIVSLNKSTGKVVSTLAVKGDIRSGVVYSAEEKAYYTSGKAGYVYRFKMDSSTGALSSLKSYKAYGAVTATPVIYSNRLYVGCQSGRTGKFLVLDATTMKEIYSCDTIAYPQASPLVSIGYENESDKIYIYLTYNGKPGGVTVFEDSQNQTAPIKSELFSPTDTMSEYCISTLTAGSDGTVYYKNDSGYVFAVTQKVQTENLSFFQRLIASIKAFFDKIFSIFR